MLYHGVIPPNDANGIVNGENNMHAMTRKLSTQNPKPALKSSKPKWEITKITNSQNTKRIWSAK